MSRGGQNYRHSEGGVQGKRRYFAKELPTGPLPMTDGYTDCCLHRSVQPRGQMGLRSSLHSVCCLSSHVPEHGLPQTKERVGLPDLLKDI